MAPTFTIPSLGFEFDKSNNATFLPRRVFDTPWIIEQNQNLLTDYSKSAIRSKTLNHLTTYRIINGLAIESQFLGHALAFAQDNLSNSLKPTIKALDEACDSWLATVDKHIPLRFRAFPISHLSKEQRYKRLMDVRVYECILGLTAGAISFTGIFGLNLSVILIPWMPLV